MMAQHTVFLRILPVVSSDTHVANLVIVKPSLVKNWFLVFSQGLLEKHYDLETRIVCGVVIVVLLRNFFDRSLYVFLRFFSDWVNNFPIPYSSILQASWKDWMFVSLVYYRLYCPVLMMTSSPICFPVLVLFNWRVQGWCLSPHMRSQVKNGPQLRSSIVT